MTGTTGRAGTRRPGFPRFAAPRAVLGATRGFGRPGFAARVAGRAVGRLDAGAALATAFRPRAGAAFATALEAAVSRFAGFAGFDRPAGVATVATFAGAADFGVVFAATFFVACFTGFAATFRAAAGALFAGAAGAGGPATRVDFGARAGGVAGRAGFAAVWRFGVVLDLATRPPRVLLVDPSGCLPSRKLPETPPAVNIRVAAGRSL